MSARETAAAMVEAIAAAWEPDYCGVVGSLGQPTRKHHLVKWDPFVPTVGWMLYLADRQLSPSDVPSAWSVGLCPPSDTLVIVSEEPVDFSVPEHGELADRVPQELGLPPPYTIRQPEPRQRPRD